MLLKIPDMSVSFNVGLSAGSDRHLMKSGFHGVITY
jgi:hypothetical protein